MVSYKSFYKRAINYDDEYKLICGLKIVHDGTGFGKTDSIARLLKELPDTNNTNYMYIANRTQLLNELQEKLPEGSYVILRRNSEILRSIKWEYIFDNQRLAKIINNYIEYFKNTNSIVSLSEIKKSYERLVSGLVADKEVHSH